MMIRRFYQSVVVEIQRDIVINLSGLRYSVHVCTARSTVRKMAKRRASIDFEICVVWYIPAIHTYIFDRRTAFMLIIRSCKVEPSNQILSREASSSYALAYCHTCPCQNPVLASLHRDIVRPRSFFSLPTSNHYELPLNRIHMLSPSKRTRSKTSLTIDNTNITLGPDLLKHVQSRDVIRVTTSSTNSLAYISHSLLMRLFNCFRTCHEEWPQ